MFDPFVHGSEAEERALRLRDLMLRADYLREADDLVARCDGVEHYRSPGYFLDEALSDLSLAGGYVLPSVLIGDLMRGRVPGAEKIAQVIAVDGAAHVRAGITERTALGAGQYLAPGDVIETGPQTMVDLLLASSVKLTLGPLARLRLDQRGLVPVAGVLRVATIELSLLTGALVSLAAPTGSTPAVMSLRTPLGWFSWSDATVGLQIAALDEPDLLAILRRADGANGQITLMNRFGVRMAPPGTGLLGLSGLSPLTGPLQSAALLDDYGVAALLPSRRVVY
jgi:hypothetical protein